MIRKILYYFAKFIINPARASKEIAADKSGIWVGLWWATLFFFCYALTALIFYLLHHLPVSTPFLPIPLEKWYLVQTFTTIPVGLTGFLAYSGAAYLLCKAMHGTGNFDQTFASQAYTIFIPMFIFMWIPETLYAPFVIASGMKALPWPGWVENLRLFVFPFLWIFIISCVALAKIHQISWWKSLIIVVISLIPMGGIMAVFIR